MLIRKRLTRPRQDSVVLLCKLIQHGDYHRATTTGRDNTGRDDTTRHDTTRHDTTRHDARRRKKEGSERSTDNTHQQTTTTTAKQEVASIKFESSIKFEPEDISQYKLSQSAYTSYRCRPYVYRKTTRRKYKCGEA